jgi:ankyrin repeat protein
MSLPDLPNELLLLIAEDLGPKDLKRFLETNSDLAVLLTPLLHKHAIHDKTVLLWAASKGNETLVRLLLDKGVDVNIQGGPLLRTALHEASQSGQEKIVRLLVDAGANLEIPDVYGDTALHRAVQHTKIVELLLDRGAKIDAQSFYWNETALHKAVDLGAEKTVELLLSRGARIDVRGYYDMTVLHLAAVSGSKEIVEMLLKNGADRFINDQDMEGETPLHQAIRHSFEPMVRILLERGADISVQNYIGVMARHTRQDRVHGRDSIEELLIKAVRKRGGPPY